MRSALGVLIVLAGCGKDHDTPKGTTGPVVRAGDAAVVAVADASRDAAAGASVLPATMIQLVTSIVPDWTSTTAEVRLWQREGKTWKLVKGPWPAVIGKSGSAWGSGLHGTGAPAGREGPVKREGDGKSPTGAFALRGTYGYARPPTPIDMPFRRIDANWKCVDDPASKAYNWILDRRTAANDWKSAEEMLRKDALYTWVVDVAHNPKNTPGDGSCIFLHVWGGPTSVTVGCTAMEEPRLFELIGAMSPQHFPAFVQLTRADYDALAPVWDLPVSR